MSKNFKISSQSINSDMDKTLTTEDTIIRVMPVSKVSDLYHPYIHNRGIGVDQKRVNQIAKSIIEKHTEWLIDPIVVNYKTGMTIDGHHTIKALEKILNETGRDIQLIVLERNFPKELTDMELVSRFNCGKKVPWATENFIECYVSEGVEDYVKLKEAAISLGMPFINKSGKPNYRYTAALVGSSQSMALRNKTFVFDNKIIERGKNIVEIFNALGVGKTSAWFEAFITAYINTFDAVFNSKTALKVFMKNIDKLNWKGETGKKDFWQAQFQEIISSLVESAA